MAGLELLYSSVTNSITCSQDALVCFVHWEIVKSGYKSLGTGDEVKLNVVPQWHCIKSTTSNPHDGERKSELLPKGWNSSKELYTLRYRSNNDDSSLLLKAVSVDSSLIFNLMDSVSDKVTDLTINVFEFIDATNLQSFENVYKNTEDLAKKLKSLLPAAKKQSMARSESKERAADTRSNLYYDPLCTPHSTPSAVHSPNWNDPLNPFAAGGSDLDPFGGRCGSMIVDPLRSGLPRSGFDPSGGIPGVLPPGAVPPGARFDPFGPVGKNRPGPDHDHLHPPGYDDMFM